MKYDIIRSVNLRAVLRRVANICILATLKTVAQDSIQYYQLHPIRNRRLKADYCNEAAAQGHNGVNAVNCDDWWRSAVGNSGL